MFKKFINDTSGNFSTMMAGSILTLFGAIGLSVDYMAMTNISTQLQAASDRAALIAASSTHLSDADRINAANISFLNISSGSGNVVSQFDFTGDRITVSAQLDYKPVILGILGQGTQTIGVSSATPSFNT